MLFTQGDGPIGIYLVRSGAVESILHGEGGKIAAMFLAGPGAVLGLTLVVMKKAKAEMG